MANVTGESSSDEFWRDRTYKTRRIPNLPRDILLRSDNVTMTLDYARKADLSSSLGPLMNAAAERADNVGIDEFDSGRQKNFLDFSEAFVVRSPTNKADIAAFIFIGPSLYVGDQMDSCLAEVQVIRSRDLSDDSYCDLVELALDMAKKLDIGYTVCITAVAGHCGSLMDVMKNKLEFRRVLALPRSVNIAQGVGLTDNVLLIRNIQPADYDRRPRSTEEVLSMLSQHGIVDGPEDDAAYSQASLPAVSILPQQRTYSQGKLTINYRDVKRHEDRLLFDLRKTSLQRGEGFSVNRFPNLASFRRFGLLNKSCVMVMEDMNNGQMAGTLTIGPSNMARSPSARICSTTTLTVAKDYQKNGLVRDILPLWKAILTHLGYKASVTFHFSNNKKSETLSAKHWEHQTIGSIPSTGYLVGSGWMDSISVYKNINNNEQHSEIAGATKQTGPKSQL